VSDSDECPKCGANLLGDPIPQESIDAGHYGDHTHFSRRIAIYDPGLDRTVQWMCPDCGERWNR
jgi:predicted RNA-binding Zn-ribbon protein involved in translation (DUF1610 family)